MQLVDTRPHSNGLRVFLADTTARCDDQLAVRCVDHRPQHRQALDGTGRAARGEDPCAIKKHESIHRGTGEVRR